MCPKLWFGPYRINDVPICLSWTLVTADYLLITKMVNMMHSMLAYVAVSI